MFLIEESMLWCLSMLIHLLCYYRLSTIIPNLTANSSLDRSRDQSLPEPMEQRPSNIKTLLMDMMRMLVKFDHLHIKFGYREINGTADILAKQGTELRPNEEILFDAPNSILEN